jgi:hypothetical protein
VASQGREACCLKVGAEDLSLDEGPHPLFENVHLAVKRLHVNSQVILLMGHENSRASMSTMHDEGLIPLWVGACSQTEFQDGDRQTSVVFLLRFRIGDVIFRWKRTVWWSPSSNQPLSVEFQDGDCQPDVVFLLGFSRRQGDFSMETDSRGVAEFTANRMTVYA